MKEEYRLVINKLPQKIRILIEEEKEFSINILIFPYKLLSENEII